MTSSTLRAAKARPADVKAAEAVALSVQRLLLATPVFSQPRGHGVIVVGALMEPDTAQAREHKTPLPLNSWLRVAAPAFYQDGTDPTPRMATDPSEFDVYINDLRPVILDHMSMRRWEDDHGEFYVEPEVTERIGGFPVYNKTLLIVTRPGDSPWKPVSTGRLLAALVAEQRVPGVAETLAALDETGRHPAAFVTGADQPGYAKLRVVPAGTAGCRPVVEADLGVFKTTAPRSAIQVVTVEGFDECRRTIKEAGARWTNPGGCTAILTLVEQMDWTAVAALLAP